MKRGFSSEKRQKRWPRAVPQRQSGVNLRGRQAGMTTLGLVILVVFLGMFAFAGLRLTPIYLNYFKIVGVIEGIHEEFDRKAASRAEILNSLRRRFNIEAVSRIAASDIQITKVDQGLEVKAEYDHSTPFIANVSFTVHFDKRAVVRR